MWKGAPYDKDLLLTQLGARWYDPYVMRFISEDPLGLAGGINPYVYANNDPINGFDPSGMSEENSCKLWRVEYAQDGSEISRTCVDDGGGSPPINITAPGDPPPASSPPPALQPQPFLLDQPWTHTDGPGTGSVTGGPGGTSASSSKSSANRRKVCAGSFGFVGKEADFGEASVFVGGIVSSDVQGLDVGSLTEVGFGGEGGLVGYARTRSAVTGKSSGFGFVGGSISAGPFAGADAGAIFSLHELGFYYEGHAGTTAGGGGYAVTSCGR
jgi:RHS repeat-associated protein